MARQNRWAAFGDAFNAVYNVGTTLGKDFDTLKILNQKDEDWKDAEGNQLTGADLQQARYNALANIEDKWGDAKAGLALRTGAIDYATKDENLRFQNRTQDDRVRYVGLRNDYTASATGLNVANTDRLNLANDYTRATNPARIERDNAQFGAQGVAYADPSYLNSLIADQTAIAAERGRDSTKASVDQAYYASPTYGQGLESAGRAGIATNDMVAARDSGLTAMYNDPTYRAGLVAKGQMEGTNAQVDNRIAQDTQGQRYNTGVANAGSAEANAQSGLLDSQRSLKLNQAITNWSNNGGDPNNEESMGQLLSAIGNINPEAEMALRKNYNARQLGEIVQESVMLKGRVNNALSRGGVNAILPLIDEYNGPNQSVSFTRDEKTGALELWNIGPDGQKTSLVARGKDDQEFAINLQGYLDPANMLSIAKDMYDMRYKDALANQANAAAASKGQPTEWSFLAERLRANPADPLALSIIGRSNPELVPDTIKMLTQQGIEGNLSGFQGGLGAGTQVPNPANPGAVPVNLNAPPNPVEEAAARNVVTSAMTLSTSMSLNDRAKLLQQNEDLLRKYQLYDNEAAKLALATEAQDAIRQQGIGDFLAQLGRLASGEGGPSNPRGLQAWQNSVAAARQKQQALSDPALLQIVLSDLQAQVARGNTSTGNARPAGERRLEQLRGRVAELEQYIQTLNANQ